MYGCSGNPLGLNRRHVTRHALASPAALFVMGVPIDCGRVRTIGCRWAVAIQANLVGRFSELGVVRGAVNVVTGVTSNSATVHDALRKVISLHPVLVRRAVGEIIEGRLTQGAVLQLPEVLQV